MEKETAASFCYSPNHVLTPSLTRYATMTRCKPLKPGVPPKFMVNSIIIGRSADINDSSQTPALKRWHSNAGTQTPGRKVTTRLATSESEAIAMLARRILTSLAPC